MPKARWTVMVLMGANNLKGEEADLTKYANRDLKEMQEALKKKHKGVPKDSLNVVVHIDRNQLDGGPQRFKLTSNGKTDFEQLSWEDGGSGDREVLGKFLRWAKRYKADHYLLVLWGHAYRLAFDRDPIDTEGLDFIKLAEELQKTNNGKKLDIVAFDSCNVSLIEGAYQLRDTAKYLVASQFSDPLPGLPYKQILEKLLDGDWKVRKDERPKDFGRAIVSQFVRHYARSNHVTMTMLDLSRVNDFPDALDSLSIELLMAANDDHEERQIIEQAFQRSQVPGSTPVGQPSVDLTTFCWNLMQFSTNEEVRIAAAALGDLLFFPTDGQGRRNPFIVSHGRNDMIVSMLNGVSIFAPNVANGFEWHSLRKKYESLDLPHATHWPNLVFALAQAGT